MRYEVLNIEAGGETAALHLYLLDDPVETEGGLRRPLVLVCPGGAYAMTSNREAEPIAIRYLAMGYHAAVLRYSVAPARFPTALLQLAASVACLKHRAAAYHLNPEQIVVQGFSAGGHLAACLGTMWHQPWLSVQLGTSAEALRPAGMLLSYPVITSGEFAHRGSFDNLLGDRDPAFLSLENQVTAQTAPTFLWHTATDATVPVENALLFFQALHRAGVPAELHIFPQGVHGLALAAAETDKGEGLYIEPACQAWLPLAGTWLQSLFAQEVQA